MRPAARALRCLTVLAAARFSPAAAQQPAPGSWVELGGFYHRVSHGFGDWKGGSARLVAAGTRNVWYLDARGQEAFGDRGVFGSLANVHHFSDRFYTQIGLGGGSGDFVFPDLRADLSLSLKLGGARRVILTAGGTWVDAKQGFEDKALFGSLAWYASGTLLVEAGGRANWSDPGAVSSARATGAVTLGGAGRDVLTLRGSAGTEGYQLTGVATTLRKFRSQEAGLLWRHWGGGRWGITLGADWYHNPFYTRAGASAGVIRGW